MNTLKRTRGRAVLAASLGTLTFASAATAVSASTPPAEPMGSEAAVAAPEPIDYSTCSGSIAASGASFPDAFYQEAITAFAEVAPDMEVTYNAIGSGSGKEEFGQNLNTFAGSDSLVDEDDGPEPGSWLYMPSTAASVTVSYNVPGVEGLNLDAETIADIFQRNITTWNDEAIAATNPDAELPDTEIIVARRADGSGTTANFTAYLDDAADNWELGTDDVVEWPADTQAGPQNTGVAQIVEQNEGAIGYVDLGDAQLIGLQMANVENAEGNFVTPSVEGTQAALAGAERTDDLTFNPLNGPGEDAYPITAPTYILLRTSYDQETFDAVKCFLTFLLVDAAEIAPEVGFSGLPEELRNLSLAQLDKVEITD